MREIAVVDWIVRAVLEVQGCIVEAEEVDELGVGHWNPRRLLYEYDSLIRELKGNVLVFEKDLRAIQTLLRAISSCYLTCRIDDAPRIEGEVVSVNVVLKVEEVASGVQVEAGAMRWKAVLERVVYYLVVVLKPEVNLTLYIDQAVGLDFGKLIRREIEVDVSPVYLTRTILHHNNWLQDPIVSERVAPNLHQE